MDPTLVDGARGAEELAKARIEDEGFSAPEPSDEPAEDRTADAADVTVEQWSNAQTLIKKFSKENIEMRAMLTRYKDKYGELED